MSETHQPIRPRAYRGPVRRLRVAVSKNEWQVTKEMRVKRMTLRPHWDPAEGRGLDAASFVEVLDAKGDVIHRQRIADPLDSSVELFEKGQISRIDSDRELVIDILAPDVKQADRVRIVAHGNSLPIKEGRKKPHMQGFKLKPLKE